MRAAIHAIEYVLPEARLENEALAAELGGDWSAEKIETKTGIRARHVAAEGECSSDLAVRAAEKLFASGACAAADIDFVLLCTQTPDYVLPTTACVVQHRLGIPTSAGALDFNLGCSGFVYGLSLAKGLVETGQAKNVLFLTAETYTKLIHPGDRSVRTLFGDAAAATLVRAVEDATTHVGPFVFGTDGRGAENLIVPTGGYREPRSPASAAVTEDESGNLRSRDHLFMNGSEIFAFTLNSVPKAVNALLEREGCKLEDVDLFVFHQANEFMLEHLRKKVKIPKEKFVVAMQDVGNTVSATIPLAIKSAVEAGRVSKGARVMCVGFGVGYSWAACMVDLDALV